MENDLQLREDDLSSLQQLLMLIEHPRRRGARHPRVVFAPENGYLLCSTHSNEGGTVWMYPSVTNHERKMLLKQAP